VVYAVTRQTGDCHVLAYRRDGGRWSPLPVARGLEGVGLIRSLHVGDADGDGEAEVVIGTRPSGAVMVLDRTGAGWRAHLVDRDQYGRNTTNTREVLVADADGDGEAEIVVATARADAQKWQSTPGAVFLYRRRRDGWERTLVEDHEGVTHTRMVAVADVKNDGVPRIVTSAVGILELQAERIAPEAELRAHTVRGDRVEREVIAPLEGMIKSRSFAAGDLDGDGRNELLVGTRTLDLEGYRTTCLYLFRYDAGRRAWERETLDTAGELGFHCVAMGDVDGDGRVEVVASDDGRGEIKVYRREGGAWTSEVVYASGGPIFCSAIHILEQG
jgi:hypothetical protein